MLDAYTCVTLLERIQNNKQMVEVCLGMHWMLMLWPAEIYFPPLPSAYVCFIYIHGYPDNEAFNPGDPVARTMNPITSCRL